jgi:hypothetical protein
VVKESDPLSLDRPFRFCYSRAMSWKDNLLTTTEQSAI